MKDSVTFLRLRPADLVNELWAATRRRTLSAVTSFVCSSRWLPMLVAAATKGPVFWIAPAWQAEALNPEGALRFLDPGRTAVTRLVGVAGKQQEEGSRPRELCDRTDKIHGVVAMDVVVAAAVEDEVERLHLAHRGDHAFERLGQRFACGFALLPLFLHLLVARYGRYRRNSGLARRARRCGW